MYSAAPQFRVLLVQEDISTAREVIDSFWHLLLDCHNVPAHHALPDVLPQVDPHLILVDSEVNCRIDTFLTEISHISQVPVFLLTPEATPGEAELHHQHLVHDYVRKPFDARSLALRIIAHLRRLEIPEKPDQGLPFKELPARGLLSRGLLHTREWLPYGWAACRACGYRGRRESFRHPLACADISPGTSQPIEALNQCDEVASPLQGAHPVANPVDIPATSGPTIQSVLLCPRCRQSGDIDVAPV